MEKKKVFWVIAVFMAALLLIGCQKDEIVPDLIPQETGLFLKSALPNERLASTWQLGSEPAGLFYFPNNILFLVEEEKARALNQLVQVVDYHVFKDGEAIFRIVEPGSVPISLGQVGTHEFLVPYSENVVARYLPFTVDDYGRQTASGNERFNGLLKADAYVLAIKNNTASVFSLDHGLLGNKIRGKVEGNSFSFKIKAQTWTLTFLQTSPVGNIFSLSVDGRLLDCYTVN